MRSYWQIFLGAGAFLTGCVLSNTGPRNSRYSVDITQMEKTDLYQETWIYRHPTKKPADYSRFYVPPVAVYPNTPGIKEREPYNRLATELSKHVLDLLRTDYALVDTPESGALEVSVAVVDMKPMVKLKDDSGNATTVYDPEAIGSKLELDCFDAKSGERIFAVSTIFKGENYEAHEDPGMIPNIRTAFYDWAAFFKQRLDAGKSQAAPAPAP